jgi:hypothetical protein
VVSHPGEALARLLRGRRRKPSKARPAPAA